MGGSSGSVSIGIAAIAKLQRHPQLSWKDCCGPCASCGWPRARFPSRGFLFKQMVFIYGVVAASSKCSDYGGAKKPGASASFVGHADCFSGLPSWVLVFGWPTLPVFYRYSPSDTLIDSFYRPVNIQLHAEFHGLNVIYDGALGQLLVWVGALEFEVCPRAGSFHATPLWCHWVGGHVLTCQYIPYIL